MFVKKFERCKIWAMFISQVCPFVMSRTDVQNGLEIMFNLKIWPKRFLVSG
jgi:hypothetical protein